MPAQQRSRRHQSQLAQWGREQLAQCAEHGAIKPGHARARVVSAQHGDFVTEHEDLDVFRCIGAGEQCQPAQHASEHQIGELERPQQAIMLAWPWRET